MADLTTTVSAITFPNPVLPAAGPNVRTGAMMKAAAEGGAGGIVSKTVSVVRADDARPTIRQTDNGGLMNAETWSETPVEEYLSDLTAAKETGLPLIASIGYRPEEVRELGALIEREVGPHAFEFSTHYTGRDVEPLIEVAKALRASVTVPVWMKISPNFPDIDRLATAVSPYVDGFVAINSFGPVLDFNIGAPGPLLGSKDGTGWMSGPPIRPIALRIVHQLTSIQEKPVIGVGGIERGIDAIKFVMAGAQIVQVCSAAIKKGHTVYGRIAAEMDEWLADHGYASLDEVRGAYSRGLAERETSARAKDATAAPTEVSSHVMVIDEEACTGCKACIKRCIHGALYMENEKAHVIEESCIGCGYCQDFCRFGAMNLGDRIA